MRPDLKDPTVEKLRDQDGRMVAVVKGDSRFLVGDPFGNGHQTKESKRDHLDLAEMKRRRRAAKSAKEAT